MWAEWYRALAELGLPPDRVLPRDLWRYSIELADVADLSTSARLARFGLKPPRPTRAEWPEFQRAGERLHGEGWRGILYPSAARPENDALCVFVDDHLATDVKAHHPPTTHRVAPSLPGGPAT